MADLAISAREQIQRQVERDLEPKLCMLLAQKVKPQAMRKEPVAKKEQHFKFKSVTQTQAVARQHSMRSDPESQVHPGDNESTLSRIAGKVLVWSCLWTHQMMTRNPQHMNLVERL